MRADYLHKLHARGWIRAGLLVAGLTITGCSGSQLILERVVTATPDPNSLIITVTPVLDTTALSPDATPIAFVTNTPAVDSTAVVPTAAETMQIVAVTATPASATATLSAFPTETRTEIYIAQQDFENGYMFWVQPQNVLWVLLIDPNNPNRTSGEWRVYTDSFVEGTDPETDPNLVAPTDRYQPRRGFGKLWRETTGLREALGWGTTPEFGLNTAYVYQPGGAVDAGNTYVPGPGKHFLTTLDKQVFALAEPGADGIRRWERVG